MLIKHAVALRSAQLVVVVASCTPDDGSERVAPVARLHTAAAW